MNPTAPAPEDPFQNWTQAIRQSDRQAYDQLYRAMYEPMVRFAIKYTRSRAIACDLVQEVFIRLWQDRTDLDPDKSIRAWLFTSVRNRCLNHARDEKRLTIGLESEPEDRPTEEITTASPSREAQLEQVMSWISELPERQKEAFSLSRFEGLEHEEIARVMEISVRTVNNHIVQALHYLRTRGEESILSNAARPASILLPPLPTSRKRLHTSTRHRRLQKQIPVQY